MNEYYNPDPYRNSNGQNVNPDHQPQNDAYRGSNAYQQPGGNAGYTHGGTPYNHSNPQYHAQQPGGYPPYQNGYQQYSNGYSPYYNNGNAQYQPGYNNQEYYRQNLYYQAKAKEERREIRKIGNMMGLCVIAFIAVQLISSALLLSNDALYDLYSTSSVFQNSFGIIFVELLAVAAPFGVMALINKNKYETPLIPNQRLKFSSLCLWVGFGMLCCVAADYIVAFMMTVSESMGYELTQGENPDPENAFACIITALATAVVPAVCEEFAMRCCSLGLLKKYGKALGVVGVSLVFGLLHGNLIQFVFATLVGLILGFVTVKTDSVVPAVLIHAFNNGMSVLTLIVEYCFGTDASNYSGTAVFVFWIVAGIVSTVILAVKHQLSFKLDAPQATPFGNTTAKKLGAFLSSPVLILSSLYLIFSVLLSIQKV